jgi:mannose-1-phosphate guanylyltransferase
VTTSGSGRVSGPPAGLCAVVLAGGRGTRMRPLTDSRPKHLLEVAGEPFVAHQLRWLAGHGVRRVALAVSYLAEQFVPVLGGGEGYGVELVVVREEEPLGTGGGLALAAAALGLSDDEPLIAVNGDLHTRHDLRAQVHRLSDCHEVDLVLHLREVADPRPYGSVVADSTGRVRSVVEKASAPPSHEVNGGTYVLRPGALGVVPGTRASLEREVLPRLVAAGRVLAHREQADWLDVGSPAALVEASRSLVLARGTPALVHPRARVDPTARLTGGTSVGAGATVGAGARVAGSVVMPGAVVGAGAVVIDSVLGRGASVEEDTRLQGAVVADGGRPA